MIKGQGHLKVSHFKVKVIPESNGNVFRFLSRSGWLAFVQMLIFLALCFISLVFALVVIFSEHLNHGDEKKNKSCYQQNVVLVLTCKVKNEWGKETTKGITDTVKFSVCIQATAYPRKFL